MTQKFSKKSQGNMQLSEHFKVAEFACHDGSDEILIDSNLVNLLEQVRSHFGKSIKINSAYRSPSYNAKIGGAKNSQHCLGTAADIVIEGVTPLAVAQYAEFLQPKAGGIGVYPSFTHVDVRASRARWDNRSGKEVAVSGWSGYKASDDDINVGNKNQNNEEENEMTQEQNEALNYIMPRYKYNDSNIPDWAKSAVTKAIQLKVYQYDNDGFNPPLSDQEVRNLVVYERLGLLRSFAEDK